MMLEEWEKWADKLNNLIAEWLENETEKTPDGYRCKRCGATIMARKVYAPIHDYYTLFHKHAGGGKVHTFIVPECPTKECPNHKPSFWKHGLYESGTTLYAPCIDM